MPKSIQHSNDKSKMKTIPVTPALAIIILWEHAGSRTAFPTSNHSSTIYIK